MKKNIVFRGKNYDFFWDDNTQIWRLINCENVLSGYVLDVEIELSNFSESVDWRDVEKLFSFFNQNSVLVNQRIMEAQGLLKHFFEIVYKDSIDAQTLFNIDFSLSGIDFKGRCKIDKDKYLFDMFFFPKNSVDIHEDIGAFAWRVHFRDALLLGVYCDHI
jgi:hypothetical protein